MASPRPNCSYCNNKEPPSRCSACQRVWYCDSKCQSDGWSSHRIECKSALTVARLYSMYTRRAAERGPVLPKPSADDESEEHEDEERYSVSETADEVKCPYSSDQIGEEHLAVVLAIRQRVRRWLALEEKCRGGDETLREEYLQATVALASIDIPPPYAFVQLGPSGKPKQLPVFRSAFASMVKTYWMAFIKTMTEEQQERVISYIDDYPPSQRIPRLNGARLVRNVQDLKLVELEGIMRGLALVLAAGISPPTAIRSWRELAEAGVWLWEE